MFQKPLKCVNDVGLQRRQLLVFDHPRSPPDHRRVPTAKALADRFDVWLAAKRFQLLFDASHGQLCPEAQKTDAVQTNRALLLSDDATINTKPELEIYADDVRCTHGATVGRLDDEALFYLRTRGIDADSARAILTYAFACECLTDVRIEAIRSMVETILMDRIGGGRNFQ